MMKWPGIKFCGDNETLLSINQACLKVSSALAYPVSLWWRSSECSECDYKKINSIDPLATKFVVVDSSYSSELDIRFKNATACHQEKWFEDFGLYNWTISDDICDAINVEVEPERFLFNAGITAGTVLFMFVLYRLIFYVANTGTLRRLIQGNVPFQELEEDLGNPASRTRNLARSKRQQRVATIDVFRGIALTLMVFVNYGGGHYSVFKHAPWNGLTVADIVFPFFIWVMGVSTVLSLRSQLRASILKKEIFKKVVRRSIILVCLGLMLNSGKGKALRIPGVLQRIGLTYFITASLELAFGKPQLREQYGPWNICAEVVDSIIQWIIVILLVVAHSTLTFFLPVPNCPTGYLGPGGISNHSMYPNCTGGAAGYIDRLIFTPDHIYQHPTSRKIYHSDVPFDPEGLLGLLTSVLIALMGMHCGRIILTYERTLSRIQRWIIWSIITGLCAGILCSWSKDNGLIPINKNLWSLSFVMANSSLAFFLFSVIYLAVDHWHIWRGGPFLYAGMNSVVIYLGHSVLDKQAPWRWIPWTSTHFELLAMDVSATALWLLVGFILYRKNIFISL